ncbi:unnamed protein product, partial [marine sediment metagenome]
VCGCYVGTSSYPVSYEPYPEVIVGTEWRVQPCKRCVLLAKKKWFRLGKEWERL